MFRIAKITLGISGLGAIDSLPAWLSLSTLVVLGIEIVLLVPWLLDEEMVQL